MHCSIAAIRKLALQAMTADGTLSHITFVQAVMATGQAAVFGPWMPLSPH
jgi:hypothetical protein